MSEPEDHFGPSAIEELALLDRYVSGEIAVDELLAPVDDWHEQIAAAYPDDDESDLGEDLFAVYASYLHIKVYDRYFGQIDESSCARSCSTNRGLIWPQVKKSGGTR